MKRNLKWAGWFILSALVLMVLAPMPNTAYAADEKKTEAGDEYNWNGFYLGANVGYGLGDGDTSFDPKPTPSLFVFLKKQTIDSKPKGILGGLQCGYNYQEGLWVIGVETDFSLTGIKASKERSPIIQNDGTAFPLGGRLTVHQDTDFLGTLRVRAGITPIPKLLLYGTGGAAYGKVNYRANTDIVIEQYPTDFSRWKAGWTAGGGAEYALFKQFTVKLEYLYYDLQSTSKTVDSVPLDPPFQVRYKFNTAGHIGRIGFNFRF